MMVKWHEGKKRFSIEDITEDEYALIMTCLHYSYERAGHERVFSVLSKLQSCIDELKEKPRNI